jgi:methionine aminotransferase
MVIFDGYEHQSVARYPKLASRSMIVYSFGKTFHATGWKVGYCLGPAHLMKEFRKVHQFTVFSVNTALQHALTAYMLNKENYMGLSEFYQEKRDYFQKLMKGSNKILPCLDPTIHPTAYEYAMSIGVASIPVSVFYSVPHDYHLLRFCFAKENEQLEKAAERLLSI